MAILLNLIELFLTLKLYVFKERERDKHTHTHLCIGIYLYENIEVIKKKKTNAEEKLNLDGVR